MDITSPATTPPLRHIRIMAVLLVIIALLLAMGGLLTTTMAKIVESRYETPAGKLLRKFSEQDQRYYAGASGMSWVGKTIFVIGMVGGIVCAIVALKPDQWFWISARMARIRDRVRKPDP